MRKTRATIIKLIIVLFTIALFGSCQHWDNFTTLFNTYYNANRLIKESESEFEYQEEGRRTKPRIFIPDYNIFVKELLAGPPPFCKEFIIDQKKLQPVKIKLDSVIIKGSKILARHPKSNYIEGTLYLMAKSFFYQNQWLASQIKCSELVDKFPNGDLAPDALLLFSKNLLIQRKFLAGRTMLSRTVDIAWMKKRYDILSEAFRLEAELSLFENDLNGALRPYKQAIAQCDDETMKAIWQIDMAALLYRMHKFEDAEKQFAKAREYSTDFMGEFESYLYEANSLIRQKKFSQADKIIEKLERNKNYDEWKPYIFAAKMTKYRIKGEDSLFIKAENFADTAYSYHPAIIAVYFEMGMELFYQHRYNEARAYFARARNVRTQAYETSEKMYFLLNSWDEKRSIIVSLTENQNIEELSDTNKAYLGLTYFELARVQEQLFNPDSALLYYEKSIEVAPEKDPQTARLLYAYAIFIRETDRIKSDSILNLIVDRFPLTEYGQDAIVKLRYTKDYVIDTAKDLYSSGSKLRQNKEYNFAIQQFKMVYTNYPENELAPKALYAIGWIFEKDLRIFDSALFYYKELIKKYPNSAYAKDVQLSVTYLTALRSGEPIPDSLKSREVEAYVPNIDKIKQLPYDTTNVSKPQDGFNILDIIKDPGKLIKSDIDLNPKINAPSLDPIKMLDLKVADSTKANVQDSTGIHP